MRNLFGISNFLTNFYNLVQYSASFYVYVTKCTRLRKIPIDISYFPTFVPLTGLCWGETPLVTSLVSSVTLTHKENEIK